MSGRSSSCSQTSTCITGNSDRRSTTWCSISHQISTRCCKQTSQRSSSHHRLPCSFQSRRPWWGHELLTWENYFSSESTESIANSWLITVTDLDLKATVRLTMTSSQFVAGPVSSTWTILASYPTFRQLATTSRSNPSLDRERQFKNSSRKMITKRRSEKPWKKPIDRFHKTTINRSRKVSS